MVASGFRSIWRNKGIGIISTITIFVVMLIIGILLLAVLNINGYVNTINDSLDRIIVYLNDEVTFNQADEMMKKLSQNTDISEIIYISKDQAIIDAEEMFKENDFVLNGLEKNPLPASIEIKVRDIEVADELVNELKADSKVEDVKYFKDLIKKFIRIDNVLKIGTFIAFIVIIILSVFVISNIIKVAISSRGAEIEIMKMVGASESFIKGPFIIEGLFYSIFGSILAFFTIYFLYQRFKVEYYEPILEYLSYRLVSVTDIKFDLAIIFLAIAVGIGSIGSLSSLRKYLKV